jgi:hypothetical protein
MSLDRRAVSCRLSDDAYKALELVAGIEDKDLGEKGRELLERILLGEVHAAKVQVARFTRASKMVKVRQSSEDDPE